jgi:ABC-type proline/glycine betaine transport system ATPase subunit
MDDPISALDASVRKKLFLNVILDHLKNKTVVLVTHAIDFIHLADKIFLMDKGRIVAQGSYDEIKEFP